LAILRAPSAHAWSTPLYFFMPDSRWLFSYIARSCALIWPIMNGAGADGVVVAAAAAAGAFGFDAFLANAPEVDTARIARPTRIAFFILSSPSIWKRTAPGGYSTLPALRHNPHLGRKFRDGKARQREPAGHLPRQEREAIARIDKGAGNPTGANMTAPPSFSKLGPFLQIEEPPMIRLVGLLLLSFSLTASANAAGGCGVGCHSTSEGACVRDGWQQALPVRNVCPATSRASAPCGPYHRWSRRSMMCIPY